MRVLIVEDEPNLGQQLKNTLEGAGYAIDLATDGEEGHFLGSTENYDAIVLDLGLPEIDGLTVLDRWRKEGKTMPVLVLTARDSSFPPCSSVSSAPPLWPLSAWLLSLSLLMPACMRTSTLLCATAVSTSRTTLCRMTLHSSCRTKIPAST